jgi:4-hydroxy-2-oxoglutarate aldolase
MGADLVSLLSPGYFKKSLTDDALYGYYADIADAIDIPVFAYNAPGFTGITLSPKLVKRMSQHPNIAGMKDSSPAGLAGYLNACGDDFAIFSGTINTLFMGLVIGVKGGVVSLANAFPEPCCALYERFTQGDLEGARALHKKLFSLNQAVSGKHGVAGVKYCMELAGFHGTIPRLPLLPLAEDAQKSIRDAVTELGFK